MSYSRYLRLLDNTEENETQVKAIEDTVRPILHGFARVAVHDPEFEEAVNLQVTESGLHKEMEELPRHIVEALGWDEALYGDVGNILFEMFARLAHDRKHTLHDIVNEASREIALIPQNIARAYAAHGVIVDTPDGGEREAIVLDGERAQSGDDKVRVLYWNDPWPKEVERSRIRNAVTR